VGCATISGARAARGPLLGCARRQLRAWPDRIRLSWHLADAGVVPAPVPLAIPGPVIVAFSLARIVGERLPFPDQPGRPHAAWP
jgi:hypothetical protein